MKYIPLKNTIINALGTFLSRMSGIVKFNVVNYLFGAGADTFYSANANILSLRKVMGEGPLVNAFLPIFSREKNTDAVKADEFASNILNQILILSIVVTLIGIAVTPWWTKTFLPGFVDDPEAFSSIVKLTSVMLLSTIFFATFSIGMGILNAHERFITSANAPILSNIVFVIFPIFTYKSMGIMSLAWAIVIGTALQTFAEFIELYSIGFRYRFFISFKDPNVKKFWHVFLPTAFTYLVQSGISIGLGYFASFLPRGSITYLRNANTILYAPVGFIGAAIAGAVFPIFAKVKNDNALLAQAWQQSFIFLLFTALPIAGFFLFYPDVLVNLIFRDISLAFSGSTGKYTPELFALTIEAVGLMGTILIPWSLSLIINKIFYSLQRPYFPLMFYIINFILNIGGYIAAKYFMLGAKGLIYADLVAAWSTLAIETVLILIFVPAHYGSQFFTQAGGFILLSGASWLILKPLHAIYLTLSNPILALLMGGSIFLLGLGLFVASTKILGIYPLKQADA